MRSVVFAVLAVTLSLPPVSLAQTPTRTNTSPGAHGSRKTDIKRKTMMSRDQEGYTTLTKSPPADFPVPAYAGSELKLSDEAVSKTGHQYYVRWYVRSPVGDLVSYYVQTMKNSGWQVTEPKGDANGGAAFVCTKLSEGSANISISKVIDVVAGKPVQKSQVVVTVHKR